MTQKSEVLMQRILHPVGQGGFYTEQFLLENDGGFEKSSMLNVVYDCGSNTNSRQLKNEISRTFKKNEEITALFISHFDQDHINGLTYLSHNPIRFLILPLLSESLKLLAFLSTDIAKIEKKEIETHFKIKVKNIIFVRPVSEYEKFTQDQANGSPINLSLFSSDSERSINSGTELQVDSLIKWIYKPFNMASDREYDIFLEELKKKDIELANKLIDFVTNSYKTKTIKEILDESEITTLKNIYFNISQRKKNETSVVVYSGPSFMRTNRKKYGLVMQGANEPYKTNSVGVLYTGDIDLNQDVDFDGQNYKAYDFISKQLSDLKKYLGIVQIPHHGSKHNFNSEITSVFADVDNYFYSYGRKNRYRHPFHGIRLWLQSENKKVIEVTDNPLSRFSQTIAIKEF